VSKQLKRAPKDRAPDSIEDHCRAALGSRICVERVTIPVAQVKPSRMKIELSMRAAIRAYRSIVLIEFSPFDSRHRKEFDL
jgi:hypothetical protein